MSKLLKQLGIGGKKTPPNPPKPDYGLKSTSVQDLLSRSHGDRFGDGTSTISVCEFNRSMTHSHTHSHNESTRSIDRKVRDKGRFSIPRQNRNERHSVNVSDDLKGKLEVVDKDLTMKANQTNQIPIPQPGIADYSDPYDVKKQMPQQMDELSDGSAITDIADDDYSIPYNAKKNKSGTLTSERQFGDVSARQSFNLGSSNAITANSTQTPVLSLPPASSNMTVNSKYSKSPQQETYEEAWKWVTPSQPQSQANGRATSTSEYKLSIVNGSNSNNSSETMNAASPVNGSCAILSANGNSSNAAVKTTIANNNSEKASEPAAGSLQTQSVGNNGDLICFEENSVADAIKKALASGMNGSNGPTSIVVSKSAANSQPMASVSYNEPWDLGNTQDKLMEKFRLASVGSSSVDGEEAMQNAVSSRSQPTNASSPRHTAAVSSNSSSVTSPVPSTVAVGYDNPMDWQAASQKKAVDDRSKEGYDRPWEWSAHPLPQVLPPKDSRPATEYDQPWDQKVKGIEKDLMKAKSSSSASSGLAQAVTAAATGDGSSSRIISVKKTNDARPPEEYDDPWDQKAKKLQDKLAGGDGSDSSSMAPGASAQQFRPSLSSADNLNAIIDVNIPLGQQGWYHGAIGRTDAETLLRAQYEGSFLVRQSESNKQDLSLSLKSSRGYMHMKIVCCDGKYILGQFSQPFDSVPLMIHHYSLNKLPIKGAEHISLTQPIVNDML